MDKMNNCGELELNNSNELRGKRIVISLEEYYRLLNDNSILTSEYSGVADPYTPGLNPTPLRIYSTT